LKPHAGEAQTARRSSHSALAAAFAYNSWRAGIGEGFRGRSMALGTRGKRYFVLRAGPRAEIAKNEIVVFVYRSHDKHSAGNRVDGSSDFVSRFTWSDRDCSRLFHRSDY
jgi:hypothetical protein